MAQRKSEDDPEMKAPMWVVTYGDLVSLLVTFFILIFTFSDVDPDLTRRVRGALSGGIGLMTKDDEKSKPSDVERRPPLSAVTDLDGQENPSERGGYEELTNAMNRKIQDPAAFDQVVKLSENPNGVRISIQADRLFQLGSWQVTGTAEEIVREVGRFFREESVDLVVEGHTDDRTWRWIEGMTAEELTLRKSLSVANLIVQETGWQPARVGVSPRGARAPVGSNEDELGREQNRRIEILVFPHRGGRP